MAANSNEKILKKKLLKSIYKMFNISYENFEKLEMGCVGSGVGKVHVVNEIENDSRSSTDVIVQYVRVGQRREEVVIAEIHFGFVPEQIVVFEQELSFFHLNFA